MKKLVTILMMLMCLGLSLGGCKEKSKSEKLVDKVEDVAEDAGEVAEDAVEAAEEAVEE